MSHWNKLHIPKYKNSPQICKICTQPNSLLSQWTSLCICRKASLTLEATIVIPLMVGFLVCILFFFRVIQVQAAVEQAIVATGRAIAVESSVVDSEEMLFLSAEALLLNALQEDPVVGDYVENGTLGIWLFESDFSGANILLHAEYRMKLPVSFFDIEYISLVSENSFRKWTGDRGSTAEETWVYVTPNGVVYHSSTECRSLDLSVKSAMSSVISKYRGKDGQKYYPCSRCVQEERGIVFYTDYGTLYHGDVSCSSLKRSIQRIPKSEIRGRKGCSFCTAVGY